MKKSLLATASLVALTLANPASAQEMDYGQLSQVFGEAVTTSATGSPQRATEVPADMQIITADEIRRTGAHSVPDVLEFVTGMDVRRNGAENTEVNVRGGIQSAVPRLLVLVNGRQTYLDYYGYTAWSALPVQMSEIRQIEVVRGPGTALFGFNAVSGVINIVTYSPLKDDVTVAEGSTGTQAYAHGSLVYTQHIGKDLGIKLSAGLTSEHDFAHKPNVKMQTYGVDARYQLLSNVELMLEGTHAESADFENSPLNLFANVRYAIKSLRAGVMADTSLGLITAEAYNNHANINKVFNMGSTSTVRKYMNDLLSVKASDLFKIGADHSIRLSVEYRDTSNNTLVTGLTDNSRIGYKVYSAGAMWNWQITDKLSLMNSVRFDDMRLYWEGPYPTFRNTVTNAPTLADYNNKVNDTITYNSGVVYKFSPNDTFRVLAGRGVQVPSQLAMVNFGSATSGTNAPAYGLFLKPSYLDNYEIGYDRRLDDINSTLRLTVYHQVITNLLQYATKNTGSSNQNGFEVELKGNSPATGLHWMGSYAYRQVSDHIAVPTGTGSNALDFENGTPKSKIIFGLGYSLDKFDVDFQGRWQSKYVDWANALTTGHVPVASYFTFNARLAYRLTEDFTLAVSGSELGTPKQVQSGGLPVERRLFITATESL